MLSLQDKATGLEPSEISTEQGKSTPAQVTKPGALRFVLVVAALVLGILAQALVGQGLFRWAITPYVVAALAMALAVARTPLSSFAVSLSQSALDSIPSGHEIPGSRSRRIWRWSERRWGMGGLALGAILLASSLYLFPKGPPNTLAWYLYGVSVVLALLALPAFEGRWTALMSRAQSRSQITFDMYAVLPWVALTAILALALAIRLYNLGGLPAGLWFDEADNISQANHIRFNPGATPVFVPSTNLPSLFLMPIAAVIELAGVSITTGRLISVAFGIAGIVAVFLLVRLMMGPLLGLVAAFLLAVMRWDINWSRIGMHGITAPLFASLTAFLLFRALRSGRGSDFGFAGAAMGLGLWFYASFRLFPLVVVFVLVYCWLSRREGRKRLVANVMVMGLFTAIVAAPVLQSAVVDSEEFFARTGTTSVFSIMPFDDAVSQMKTSLGKHALMFHVMGDPNPRHNLPDAPMLDLISGVLLVLGLVVVLAKWRNVALAVLPFWIFFMVLPGVITIPWEAPQSLRAITVIPAVIAVITLAFGVIWRAGRSAPWPKVRKATPLFVAALLGAIAFMNVNTYFGAQARHPEVFASFSTDETLMAPHMVQQQRRGYSLLVSRQFLYSLTASLLANNPRFETIAAPTNIPLDPEQVWLGASIYLEPREAGFYHVLKTYYPDARFEEVRPPGGGDMLYYSAVISREQLEENQGIIERHIFSDGSVREVTKTATESFWFVESSPDDVPFDLEWKGSLHVVLPGEYTMTLEGDTDVEVLLDGSRILWSDQPTAKIEPAVGLHTLEVRGRVQDRNGFLRLLWQPPGHKPEPIPASNLYHGPIRPVGLAGRFYVDGQEGDDTLPDAMRVTPTLDNFWYDPVIPEPYHAVWEGLLDVPESGEYSFKVEAFGSLKLLLDDEVVVETPGEDEAQVTLKPGKRSIRIEYLSEFPPSDFEVLWAPPGMSLEPVPIERLSPAPGLMFRFVDGE